MSHKSLTGYDASNKAIINVADPSSLTDAANKQYVDNLVAGLATKRYARLASTANVTIASGLAAGQSLDGKTIATGDRIFLKNQTTGSENGIYVAPASGAATRATDFDAGTEVPGALITVSEGTVNGDTMWLETTDGPITIGTTALAFTLFQTGITYTADGQGITLSTNQFSLVLDGTTLAKSGSGLKIGPGANGNGLSNTSGQLAVLLDTASGLLVSGTGLKIDPSVVARKYAADCAATTNPQTFTHNLGTKDVQVTIRRASDDAIVFADVTAPTTNTVAVDFGGAPTSGQYRVVVLG
jgi:phage-related tail fiber protein